MYNYIKATVSHQICGEINKKRGRREVSIDPATAIMIAKIVLKIILAIRECKQSNTERENTIRNPSWSDDWLLKGMVRKQMGWLQYLIFGAHVIGAIKGFGRDAGNSELTSCGLYDGSLSDGKYYRRYVEL